MTIKEAIEKLQKDKENLEEHDGYFGTTEHIDIAIEALKKQIPQKPVIYAWCPAHCPSCDAELSESLGDGYYKHWCGKNICECGQKLKWE